MINLELPWNPAVLEQRIGRIYRLGQKQPIDVFNLVCEEGIESRIAGLVGSKQAFFKGLFDGESDSVQFDQSASFLARVEKIYEPVVAHGAMPADGLEGLEDDEVRRPRSTTRSPTRSRRSSRPPTSRTTGSRRSPKPTRPESPPTSNRPRIRAPNRRVVRSGRRGPPAVLQALRSAEESDGRVVLEAPPEAASALGALFEGMAALLQSSSGTAGRNGDGPA